MTAQSIQLAFGLDAIPQSVDAAWGARFIYPDDLLWDRQDMKGSRVAMDRLILWLNSGPLKSARESARVAADRYVITTSGSQKVILYQDDTGVIIACPNSSYGYLYVSAWIHDGDPARMPDKEFTPIPPKPKTANITFPLVDGTRGKCGLCGKRRVIDIIVDGVNQCAPCTYAARRQNLTSTKG